MNSLFLICNSHLDPVWLWEWEEGAAAAISTFRTAADCCELYDGFIFNHNEVTLYKWVAEYEPELFARIQRLVKEGKWHIMGGWYLQPDVNLPCAESVIRQMLTGRKYFKENFGVLPTTAINFDSFGHSRGIVQLIRKCGYDSYLICRPGPEDVALPAEDFVWTGFDGSEIMVHRSPGCGTPGGRAVEKIAEYLDLHAGEKDIVFLWGVGDHGGGPSKKDLAMIRDLIDGSKDVRIRHSTPEEYFAKIGKSFRGLPRFDRSLNPFAVGCYTSMTQIKQKHRKLENELYMLEKMLSHAALAGLLDYPRDAVGAVTDDLMQAEFHDILPGSSIQPVEETSIRLMNHALEEISRLKARAFFALTAGQEKAVDEEIPILAYNPHPYAVEGIFECEFQLADVNWKDEFTYPIIYQNGIRLQSQTEKEYSYQNLDLRKRLIFRATLEPGRMNRFDCRTLVLPSRPAPNLKAVDGLIRFNNGELRVIISAVSGLMESYRVDGSEYLSAPAFRSIVMNDLDDAWGISGGMTFRDKAGEFALMSAIDGTEFSGLTGDPVESVRVIEDGEVRTVVEALFRYGDSFIRLLYKLPKKGSMIEVDLKVVWNESAKMLKLAIPLNLKDARYIGQVCGGVEDFTDAAGAQELAAHKWNAAVSDSEDRAFISINNGTYGLDYTEGQMRLSLLRSPAYTGYRILDRPIVPPDRHTVRMDRGDRNFTFWFDAGRKEKALGQIEHEAAVRNETPFMVSFFPSGHGAIPASSVTLSSPAVQVTAFKKSEFSEDYILRLYNPTGAPCRTEVRIPAAGIANDVLLKKFEIKTYSVSAERKSMTETTMLEGLI